MMQGHQIKNSQPFETYTKVVCIFQLHGITFVTVSRTNTLSSKTNYNHDDNDIQNHHQARFSEVHECIGPLMQSSDEILHLHQGLMQMQTNHAYITEDVLAALIGYHQIVCHHIKFPGTDFMNEEKVQNQLMITSDLHACMAVL